MEKSENINELAAALARAQASLPALIKDASNPFFKSQYATLAACTEAIRKPFAENGLSVVQVMFEAAPGYIGVETVIMHSSGQWISGKISGKAVKDDPQAMGSAMTYFRRYSLMAIVGLAPEDDDANLASGKEKANDKQAKKVEEKKKVDSTSKADQAKDEDSSRTVELDKLKTELSAKIKKVYPVREDMVKFYKFVMGDTKPTVESYKNFIEFFDDHQELFEEAK